MPLTLKILEIAKTKLSFNVWLVWQPYSYEYEINIDNNILIKNGRYGKFITNGKVNAPMPKGVTEDELQLDEAIKILSTRKPKKFKKRR